MRAVRASLLSIAALALVAGAALAPLVELHEHEAHGGSSRNHAHTRHDAASVADLHHHPHGTHDHAVVELSGALVPARPANSQAALPALSFPFPSAALSPAALPRAGTPRPPRTPHPLSISGVLRV